MTWLIKNSLPDNYRARGLSQPRGTAVAGAMSDRLSPAEHTAGTTSVYAQIKAKDNTNRKQNKTKKPSYTITFLSQPFKSNFDFSLINRE